MSSVDIPVSEAKTDQEIVDCHPTIVEVLRPHRTDVNDYVSRVRRQQQHYNYRLISARDQNNKVVSILGFKVEECLWFGKTVYIDDFATLSSARAQGYGDALMNWIIDYAKSIDCDVVHLDSGYGRHDAHRFNLNHGFDMTMHHFVYKINK